jgi:membrane-associated phospholipid phosphatase
MKKYLALAISVLLHPLLMPSIIFFCIFQFAPILVSNIQQKWILLLLIFSGTYLVPIFLILTMYNMGIVKDIKLDTQKERRWPMTAATVIYIGFTFLLSGKTPGNIPFIMTGITFALALVTIITRYWKISAHSLGSAGTSSFLLLCVIRYGEVALLYPALIMIVLTGVLISARLYLKAHDTAQIVGGVALGIFVSLGIFLI